MAESIVVSFQGPGSGTAALSWGQRELWGGMVRQQTWMPMGIVLPLPPGRTLDDVAAELRFIMERFPSMRTRLRRREGRPPLQVLAAEGAVELEVVDAGAEEPEAVAARVSRRLHDTPFDFERDWPVRTAVIRRDGVLTHQVTVVCHLVNDGFGGLVLAGEVAKWHAGEALPEPTAMSPLEQAEWQASDAGRRQSAAALRYWEKVLRAIDPQRFPGPVDARTPRHWQARFRSRALHLAAEEIARRTGADRSTVLLTAFAVALAETTGIHPVVVRVVVNNRFRRALAESVSPVSQPALCVLDVADRPFAEAVQLTGQRTLVAYKHAYFDPDDLDALIARVGAERGAPIDIACYFNDRRAPSVDAEPGNFQAAAGESTFAWIARQDRPNERLFLTIEADPHTVDLDICGDTGHIPPAMLEAVVRGMEAVTVSEVA
ncbi:condensation domain-containing protein [Dactylosporangium sp. NPDC051541]|uniref:condensation domain-containing protein n=1 Tax=Dactylosporangium sp. NPDC051541 TaxID=3363977 RepID=UPI0037B490A7